MTGSTVSAEDGTTDMFGTLVSALQNNISVGDNKITGTLYEQTTGQIVTDWGAGYFLALKFSEVEGATSYTVGLDPSVSSGPVQLDADMNGIFKITDKDEQKLYII